MYVAVLLEALMKVGLPKMTVPSGVSEALE